MKKLMKKLVAGFQVVMVLAASASSLYAEQKGVGGVESRSQGRPIADRRSVLQGLNVGITRATENGCSGCEMNRGS